MERVKLAGTSLCAILPEAQARCPRELTCFLPGLCSWAGSAFFYTPPQKARETAPSNAPDDSTRLDHPTPIAASRNGFPLEEFVHPLTNPLVKGGSTGYAADTSITTNGAYLIHDTITEVKREGERGR